MDRVLSYLTVFSVIKLLSLVVTLAVGIPMVGALQLVLLAVLIDLPVVMVMAFDPPSKGILKEEDIDALALDAYNDACRPGNPKDVSLEDIKALYRSLL
jgi:magnesium-transporting ATPase (P-type)